MNRGPKRFTPTTFILVVLLIGAVMGISILVNPRPAMPEAPPSPEQVAVQQKQSEASAATEKENMMKKMREEKIRMAESSKLSRKLGSTTPVVKNPDAIDVDNKFFRDHAPGSAGQKQEAANLVELKKQFKAYQAVIKTQQVAPAEPTK